MENDEKSAQIEKRMKYVILAFCAVVIIGLMFVICDRQPTDSENATLCNQLVLEQSMLTRDIAAFETAANQVDMFYNAYYERIKRYNDTPNGHWARQRGSATGWMDNTSAQFRLAKRQFEEALAANRSMYKEKCQKK